MIWQPGTTLAEIEKEVIGQALAHFDGNRTYAARALGICIRTLRTKITSYGWKGIDWEFLPDNTATEKQQGVTVESFEGWFNKLTAHAAVMGCPALIKQDAPESYLDYFEDGDSVEQVFNAEFSHSEGGGGNGMCN